MKRILIISPGPFSLIDNDGQTLEDLFQSWSRDCLAQFYTQEMDPDFAFCQHYYRVSDRGVLNYLVRKEYNPKPIQLYNNKAPIQNTIAKRRIQKSPLTLFLRNFLWRISPWARKGFYKWVDDFRPDLIFFEVGDNIYLMKLVIRLQKRLRIPLMVHNTEGFFFFKQSYMKKASAINNRLLYPLFHRRLVKNYRLLMSHTSYVIYLCDKLKVDYDKCFNIPSSVIYKSSNSIASQPANEPQKIPLVISYLGSLGLFRPKALIEVADVLMNLEVDCVLDVYGQCKSATEKELLEKHPRINYKGFVSFDVVQNVIKDSDILLHVESEKSGDDVMYGFSTKIPDSLASGKCFFMYAPSYVAGASYLSEHVPEAVAFTKDDLEGKLKRIIYDKALRYDIVERELLLANSNHNPEKISKQIKDLINGI